MTAMTLNSATRRGILFMMVVGVSFAPIPAETGSIGTEFPYPVLLVSSDNTNNVIAYDGLTGQPYGVFAQTSLVRPRGFTFSPSGDLFVSSSANSSIVRFNGTTGSPIGVFVPSGAGGLDRPQDLAFDSDGNLLVSDSAANRVRRYNGASGAFMGDFLPPITQPNFFIIHDDGFMYVLSSGPGDSVRRYNAETGAFDRTFVSARSGGLNDPQDLAFGPDGNLYVSSGETDQVLRYNGTTGAFVDAFVSAGSGGLNYPKGIAFGPDGNLYVASYFGSRVIRYSGQTGDYIDSFVMSGSGGLNGPIDVEFILSNYPPTRPTVEVFLKRNSDASHDFFALASESTDPESDPIELKYSWLTDGLAIEFEPGVPVTGPVVRRFFGSPGQKVDCIVTPTDGNHLGPSRVGSIILGVPELFPDGIMNAKDLLILLQNWQKEIGQY